MVLFVKLNRLLLVVVLVLISTSRVIIPIVNNAVFSTDSWPLIKLTQQLLEDPWVKILGLSTRHAKYPLAVVFSIIYVEVTSVSVYVFYVFIGVLLIAFTLTILLYTILSKSFEKISSVFALLALLIYPPFTIFTSAYLKETYAYPLSLLLLLLAILTTRRSMWIVVTIVGLTLVLSHPLTSLITIVSILTYIYIKLVERIKLGVVSSSGYYRNLVVITLLLSVIYIVYTILIGPLYVFNLVDIVVLVAYSVVLYATYYIFYADRRFFTALTIILLLIAVFTYIGLIENIQVGLNIVLYSIPLLLLIIGLYKPSSLEGHVIASILLPVGVGVFYTLTYAKWLVTITHRFLNYLVYPLIACLLVVSRTRFKVLLVLVVIVLFANCCIVLHSVSTGRDPILFYWRYTVADLVFRDYVVKYSVNHLLSGVKYSYMLGEEVASVSLELTSMLYTCSLISNTFIVISYEELFYGVPLSPLHYVKPTVDLFKCSSVVYSSLESYLLVK